jgi:hypothetical protein
MSSSLVRVGDGPMISPHPLAPLYDTSPSEQQLLLNQAIQIAMGSGIQEGTDEPILIRQTGLVNLWFFLRFIASYNGPYDRLNADLHVDMCNFAQLTDYPGMKAAAFVFRGAYKSSIFTHGHNTWKITREPNHDIILASNIYERSLEFLEYTKVCFKDNELFGQLYPEHVPTWGERQNPHWNKQEMITPAKTRYKNKPNIRAVAVGGSVQGLHAAEFKIDDLIGEHQMNANQLGGAEFEKARNWARAAVRNIPTTNHSSRIFVTGTRYGPNDSYVWIWDDMKTIYGYTSGEPYRLKENGEWDIYYRSAREDIEGVGLRISMPEKWSHEELDKIQEEDPWTYYTQLENRSTFSGLSEFADYSVRECTLTFDLGQAYVERMIREGQNQTVYLSDCDLLITVDPAGMTSKESTRTSKWAIAVYMRDYENVRYILEAHTKFGPPSEWIPIVFRMFEKYRRFGVRGTFIEMIGPFSILQDTFRQEQQRRGQSILLRPVKSQKGDKVARIRHAWQPVLDAGLLYATPQCIREIQDQIRSFPNGAWMDLLDAMTTAETSSYQPRDPDRDEEEEYERIERARNADPWTGYGG